MGEADIRMTNDKYNHETTALVSSNVNYNLLVASHDLKLINFLSHEFSCVCFSQEE